MVVLLGVFGSFRIAHLPTLLISLIIGRRHDGRTIPGQELL